MTVIPFTWDVDGDPTDATSVVFSNAGATYGLLRTDTSAIIVAAGTAFTHVSTGVYSYTVTDPAGGLTYDYWVKVIYDGDTFYYHLTQVGDGVPDTVDEVAYPFTSREEIDRLYSTLAVKLRMDDLSSTEQTNLINELVGWATDTVASFTNRFYRSSDLVNSPWVRRRATIIAAYYLSMRRANGTQFGMEYQRVMEELERFLTSTPPQIPGVPIRTSSVPTASTYIVDDRNRYNKLRVSGSLSMKTYPGQQFYQQPNSSEIT